MGHFDRCTNDNCRSANPGELLQLLARLKCICINRINYAFFAHKILSQSRPSSPMTPSWAIAGVSTESLWLCPKSLFTWSSVVIKGITPVAHIKWVLLIIYSKNYDYQLLCINLISLNIGFKVFILYGYPHNID